VAEDSGATTIFVLGNDSDADGDPFSIASPAIRPTGRLPLRVIR
jgi:hypothetical protein